MEVLSVGLNAFYIFNSERFSYKAAFVRNQIQLKSAGSLIIGASFDMFILDADSSIVPPELSNYFDPFDLSDRPPKDNVGTMTRRVAGLYAAVRGSLRRPQILLECAMPEFIADLRVLQFNLVEQCRIERLFQLPKYKELDLDTINAILDEGYKFAKNQMAPMNAVADAEGVKFDKSTGKVTLPEVFRETYKLYCENGWLGFWHAAEWGGQGMP